MFRKTYTTQRNVKQPLTKEFYALTSFRLKLATLLFSQNFLTQVSFVMLYTADVCLGV